MNVPVPSERPRTRDHTPAELSPRVKLTHPAIKDCTGVLFVHNRSPVSPRSRDRVVDREHRGCQSGERCAHQTHPLVILREIPSRPWSRPFPNTSCERLATAPLVNKAVAPAGETEPAQHPLPAPQRLGLQSLTFLSFPTELGFAVGLPRCQRSV